MSTERHQIEAAGDASEPLPVWDLPQAGEPSTNRWRRDSLRRRLLAGADSVAALTASAVVAFGAELGWAVLLLPVWILAAKVLGLYDRDHRALRHLTVDEIPSLAVWAFIVTGGLELVMRAAGEPVPLAALGITFASALAAAACFRYFARRLWRRLIPPERTAIVGEGTLTEIIARKLELFPDMHLEWVPCGDSVRAILDGDEAAIWELAGRVDRIVVASDRVDPDPIGALVAACRREETKLSVVSPLRGRALPLTRMTKVADLAVFEFDTWDVSRSTMLLKRTLDLAGSVVGLVLTLPFLPLVALAIRLDSPGPVFFSQARAGLDRRPFRMHKLRTMTADAEGRLSEVVSLDSLEEPMFKLPADPRVTRVGRRLRRLSLDELPQLWNVLVGDMSLVGPRPEELAVVARYKPEHMFRLEVKPGLTGPMQVFGRGRLTFPERLAVELDYVENVSLARDLRILALTGPNVVRGTGAY